ncbi:hypothetical protein BGZ46_008009 [Entomortierella lignicola]|nr:hypothetical protein BGZ46_008009 [Entomortierella lignicola]
MIYTKIYQNTSDDGMKNSALSRLATTAQLEPVVVRRFALRKSHIKQAMLAGISGPSLERARIHLDATAKP